MSREARKGAGYYTCAQEHWSLPLGRPGVSFMPLNCSVTLDKSFISLSLNFFIYKMGTALWTSWGYNMEKAKMISIVLGMWKAFTEWSVGIFSNCAKITKMRFSRVFCQRVLVTQSCPTLCDPMNCRPSGLLCLWNSPGKNTSHSLFQGIFLIQGSNLGLLHCRRILYHLSLQESPATSQFFMMRAGHSEWM